MPPNIYMMAGDMGLSIGSRYVLYMGRADGVDQLAKDLGKHFGIQVDLNTLAANS